ncbi:hypothetical protein TSAR_002778 [Trichomalopsis sarcophagae]|uniref:Methuselah N-terminal domain-containing protein n=1 Tax=Trichomalopsis sarcophagae TaxID=543379 RepID=A0A232FK76_9HYME|nr:hypothetical protein TSAR_002778 [Trichomalopsis sarcophagae]
MLLIRCCCCCFLLVSASAALGDEDFRENSENNLISVIEEEYLTLLLLNSDDKKAATKSSSSFSAEKPPIIPVCCQTGYHFKRNVCIKSDNATLAPEFPQIFTPDLQPSNKTLDDFSIVYQYPCEADSFGMYPGDDDFYLLENGTILTVNLTSPSLITQIDYCVTVHMDADNNSVTVIAVCLPPESSIPMFYSIFNFMSALFLLGTFFIYTVISDLQNIHGIIVRAYVSALTVAYFALAIVQFGDQYVLERLLICQALGKYYTFIAYDGTVKLILVQLGSRWLRDKRDEGREAWQIRKGGSCAISAPRAVKLVATMPSISALGLLVLLFLSLTSYPLYLSFPSTDTDQPCHELVSVSLENATEVFANGSVFFDGLTFPKPTQYRDEKGRLRGCPCLVKKCIRFCCRPGEIHDKLHKDRPVLCHKPSTNETYEDFDLPPLPDGVLDASVGGYEDFYTIHRQGCIVPKQATIYLSGKMAMKSDSPSITAHGHFKLEHTKDAVVKTYIHEPDSYCVAYSKKHNASKIRLCNSPSEARKEKMENAMRWSETAGSWLSVIFLIATFTVYSLFPVLRNLPGKTLMAHVASMALAYISLPFIKHAEIQNSILDIDGCKTMAINKVLRATDGCATEEKKEAPRQLCRQQMTDQPCHELVSVSLENVTEVFANGSVLFNGPTFPNASTGTKRTSSRVVRVQMCCQPREIHDKLCYKLRANETIDDFDLPPLPEVVLEEFYVMSYCLAYSRVQNATKIFPPEDKVEKIENAIRWLETAAGYLSVISLIATFTVYSLFPILRNLHGKILMANVASLLSSHMFLPFVRHKEMYKCLFNVNGCKAMGMDELNFSDTSNFEDYMSLDLFSQTHKRS